MNASHQPDTTQTTAPPPLWRVAEAFMHILHTLFGAPEDVAERHTLTAKAHKQMASWLRCAEAMLRRLLLIEAAAFAKPNARPLLRAPRKRVGKLMHFTAEAPDKWRVSFHCFTDRRLSGAKPKPASAAPSPPQTERPIRPFIYREERPNRAKTESRARRRSAKRTRAKPILRQEREWIKYQPPLAFRSAWPLAERYEALLRVFNYPIAYARRLARRLYATPHRLGEVLRAPPEAHNRVGDFAMLTAAAESGAARFNSS